MKKINKYGLSRYIPVPVEETVRTECGFGCAICGEIFVELHHFYPEYFEAKTHDPKCIVALCEKHHQMAGSGEISLDEIKKFRKNPIALEQGFVRQDLFTNAEDPVIIIGSNVHIAKEFSIIGYTVPILWIGKPSKESPLVINATFRDSNFSTLLAIRNNVIIKEDLDISIQKLKNRYIIGKKSKPLLDLELEGGNMVKINNAQLNGINSTLFIKDGVSQINNTIFINNIFQNRREYFGHPPRDIFGKLNKNASFSYIFDGFGKPVGIRQNELIFDLNGRLLSKISGEFVQRVFMKDDGTIVEEGIMGILRNNAIFPSEQGNPKVPKTPIPLKAVERIQQQQQEDGLIHETWCISRFFCDSSMPLLMTNCTGFLILNQ